MPRKDRKKKQTLAEINRVMSSKVWETQDNRWIVLPEWAAKIFRKFQEQEEAEKDFKKKGGIYF